MVAARILALLAFLALSGGSAHPAGAAPLSQTPGTLVIDTTAESESMDPYFVTQSSGFSVMGSIFDNLIERGYDGSIQPMLADSWSTPDPTTVEFKLHQGVKFHNGETFDANSVKFSIERFLDPKMAAPLAGTFPKSFQGVEIVDDYTVRFHFAQSEPTVFDALGLCCAMLPPRYYSDNAPDVVAANPVGSGPFKFVEWVRDDHTTLAVNPTYWGTETYKGTPLVPTVIFRPVPQAATRSADLLNGTADIIFDVAPDDIDMFRGMGASGFQIVPNPIARLLFVEYMPKKATDPLADRRVRQALNYAVDVEALIDNLFKGLGQRQSSPIVTGTLGYEPSVAPYDYNPTYAKQLLAAAGYPNGFSVTMDLSSSENPAAALAVVGQLKQVGVEVTPRTLELATFNSNWSPGKSGDMRIARWGGIQDPALFVGFTSVCGGFLADPFTCNQEATGVAREAAGTFDQDARARLYSQFARILRDDPMGIYLSNVVSIYGVGPRAQGWRGATGEDKLIPTNITLVN
jgi:peptide/nickel transport system substrate-binding protein